MMKGGNSLATINIHSSRICRTCLTEFDLNGSNSGYCPKHRKKRKKEFKRFTNATFVALDGEADTTNNSSKYVLMGIGSDPDKPLINVNGIEWIEVFQYLYEHFIKGNTYIGFFLGYDFNQWFKTLPMERAAMLLTSEGREKRRRRNGKSFLGPFPVDYEGWEWDILGSKRLRIRPKACNHYREKGKPKCKCEELSWMYICDVGPFFQTALINVINPANWDDPIVTDEEFAIIVEGKENRSNAALDAEMIEYNRLENEILERVMRKYDKGLREIGVYLQPDQWYGPGQAAQYWMRHNGAPTAEEIYGCKDGCKLKHSHFDKIIPEWFLESAQFSYYGGWFEQMMHGIIPGISHEYDINSAYPYIIANMPCLLHGKYTKGTGVPYANGEFVDGLWKGDLCLVKATVWSPEIGTDEASYIGAMLHRNKNGGISRPKQTNGWYWYHELQAAYDAECIREIDDEEFYEWVKYEPCDCTPPMAKAQELYDLRLKVGKNTPIGIACKLVLNSMYGKFAQSIGSPVFGNSIYASLITAGCRAMILQAIASHPYGKSDVIMVATDAVYFLHEHKGLVKYPDKKILGDWDHSKKTNLTLWAPGFYWDDKTRKAIAEGERVKFKARGVDAKSFASEIANADTQFRAFGDNPPPIIVQGENGVWHDSGLWPKISYTPSFAMTTCLQALMQNDWSLAGHVRQTADNTQLFNSANPYMKRVNGWYDPEFNICRSDPYGTAPKSDTMEFNGYTISSSTAYSKKFGLEDPFSEESKGRYGLTQDGYVGDEFRNILVG